MDAQQEELEEVVEKKKEMTMEERGYMRYHFRMREDDWDPNASDRESDYAVYNRACWIWRGTRGSFEDTTSIPEMRFTDNPGDRWGGLDVSLQIYSIKVAEIRGGLRWPLHVFGLVAARDNVDHNRNIIFARPRSNCQTITQEDPYLALTGPTRAIVVRFDPGELEFFLKVKGATESEDRELSFSFVTIRTNVWYDTDPSSANSRLELACRRIPSSVEATIILKLISTSGSSSWPRGFRGVFAASTASANDEEVSLLAFGDNGERLLPLADDGCTIKLSRRVVSVGFSNTERLRVSVRARSGDQTEEQAAATRRVVFRPKKDGRSYGVLKVESCKIKVTVAWSLLSQWG